MYLMLQRQHGKKPSIQGKTLRGFPQVVHDYDIVNMHALHLFNSASSP